MQDYFIGNFLVLETSGERNPFSVRLLEGVENIYPGTNAKLDNSSGSHNIDLLLDGQQRLTSVFYALYQPSISLGDSSNPYNFYLKLDSLLKGDEEDSVEGVSTRNSKRINEANEQVSEGKYLPFNLLKEQGDFYKWLYQEKHSFLESDDDKNTVLDRVNNIFSYQIPVISMSDSQGTEAVVETFERINRFGTNLSTFDLLVARLYPHNVKLRDLWEEHYKSYQASFDFMGSEQTGCENILKVMCLSRHSQCRKTDLLKIEPEGFNDDWSRAVINLSKGVRRLKEIYGSIQSRWIPFRSMVVPLAALLYSIQERGSMATLFRKLDCWYWCAVFSARYQRSADTFAARDYGEIRDWFADESKMPEWIRNFSFNDSELDEALGQRSGVYRSVVSSISNQGARDPITGQQVNLDQCEDDHIFPLSVFKEHQKVNSVLNRTLISRDTNREKGHKKPSEYLPLFLEKLGDDEGKLKSILRTHFIDDKAYRCMLEDEIEGFLEARRSVIREAIGQKCSYSTE